MKTQSITLIGMAGAGKTTIGRALAGIAGLSFLDLDVYIQEKDGSTIQEIIDKKGERAFLQLEARRLREIDLQCKVLAPGGSIIYNPQAISYLKEHSLLVFLDESYENIEARVQKTPHRGVIGLHDKTLRQVFDERRPLYLKYADIIINPSGRTPEQIAGEILQKTLSRE